MKKLSIVCVAVLYTAATAGMNVELSIEADNIRFSTLAYQPERVSTNTARQWVDGEVITTNGLFIQNPGKIVTNAVQRQVETTTVSTNAPAWHAPFILTVKADTPVIFNSGLQARPRRHTELKVQLALTPPELETLLGSDFYALIFSAAKNFGPQPIPEKLGAALRQYAVHKINQ